jgi:hypothetical protein
MSAETAYGLAQKHDGRKESEAENIQDEDECVDDGTQHHGHGSISVLEPIHQRWPLWPKGQKNRRQYTNNGSD